MDELDFKILKILDKNCRISNSKIASELNISNRTVSSRISHMLDEKIIKYFSIEFNTNILGFRHYIGRMKRNLNIKIENFYNNLKKIPDLYRFWEILDGSYTFSFFSKNSQNLEQVLEKIQYLSIDIINYNENRNHLASDIPFSKLDWKIIYYLFYNSRASQKEISLNLNISEKTILILYGLLALEMPDFLVVLLQD